MAEPIFNRNCIQQENIKYSFTGDDYFKRPEYSADVIHRKAMQWIEDNTDEDALLATDRYYSVPLSKYSYENRWNNRFFLYPVYANRFCYISGSGYNLPAKEWTVRRDMIETNAELYDPDNENRGDLARELDVDYVVVSRRFNDAGDLSNKDYKLCYSNDDVYIYEVEQ